MAHPELNFDPPGTFTFSNGPVTIEVATTIEPPLPAPPESVTVNSATLTNPHDTFVLDLHDFVVPPPVVERLFEQATSSVASIPNATLSQEAEMVDLAVTDPEDFLHIFEGGSPALREPVVQGRVEGLLGGPDTRIAIDIAVTTPPAFGDPGGVIAHRVEESHLTLNHTVELSIKLQEPEALSYSWGSTNPETDWLIV
jgi:hypothetical protein